MAYTTKFELHSKLFKTTYRVYLENFSLNDYF